MEKQLGWTHQWGGAESLGISGGGGRANNISQVDGVSNMALACPLHGSAEGGFRKGTMASARPDARHFSLSKYATGALQDATLVVELRGSESE